MRVGGDAAALSVITIGQRAALAAQTERNRA